MNKRPQSKNILIYYKSLRSNLLFKKILCNHPNLFDCVIEMPAIPYSRKTNKRNFKKIFKTILESPEYVIMQFFIIYFYSFLSFFSKKTIKNYCYRNNIKHYYFKKIDNFFLSFLKAQEPNIIINSTSCLLPKIMIQIPSLGVINFHEAPLPSYRGSASYFWFFINNEIEANVTCHFVDEELDAGNIIFEGSKIKINESLSVFDLWIKMLLSHKDSWNYILPFLYSGKKIPSKKQTSYNKKNYSYPDKLSMDIFRKNKIKVFILKDIITYIKASLLV
tara:strand:+ start:2522 stop:3352 length:831 start_codon:yes stop_codon:yes gene_type:complete